MNLFLFTTSIDGQVSVLKDWTTAYNGTGNNTSTNYDIPAGSNRFLVVAIASARDNNGTRRISSITYGGQTLSLAVGNMTESSYRAHTSIYYLNEAGIVAAGSNKTLVVNFNNDGTARSNSVFASVFQNVNQTDPIVNGKQYSNGSESSSASFTDFKININNQAVKVLSSYRYSFWIWNRNREISNFGANWGNAKQIEVISSGLTSHNTLNAVGTRNMTTSYITDPATVTMDGSSYLSMSGISIRAVPKYFRSIATGNWNSTSTWEQSLDSATWSNATSYPTYDDYRTTIQAGDTVTLNGEAGVSDIDVFGILDTSNKRFLGANSFNLKEGGKLIIGGNENIEEFFSVNIETNTTVEYNGSDNQTIYPENYYHLILGGSGGTKTFVGTTNVRGNLTANRPVDSSTSPNNAKVQFTGNGNQSITGNTNTLIFVDLLVNKSSGNLILEKEASVSGNLTLIKGHINTVNGLLIVTNTSPSAILNGNNDNDFSNSYIIGPLARNITNQSADNYIYPISKNGNYYGFYLNNPSVGSGTTTAKVEAFEADAGGTKDSTIFSKSNTEYWELGIIGNLNNASISISRPSFISPYNIVVGSSGKTGEYTALYGNPTDKSILSSDNINSNRFFTFGQAAPTIISSSYNLTGFTYSVNYGPSSIQSIDISGSYLLGNITVDSTKHFEISRYGAMAFNSTNKATYNVVGSTINPTPLYIRLKSGLAAETYKDTLILKTQDGIDKEVILHGVVTGAPQLSVDKDNLSFQHTFTKCTTDNQAVIITGNELVDDVIIRAPNHFGISSSDNDYYEPELILSPTNGNLRDTIYVGLLCSNGIGLYQENIQIESLYAETVLINCTGEVLPQPAIFNSVSTLVNTIYTEGEGPSGLESFEVSGTNLLEGILIAAPITSNPENQFKLSLNGSDFYSQITITENQDGQVPPTMVYLRLEAGLDSGIKGPYAITLSSEDAQTKVIMIRGQVIATDPHTNLSTEEINNFGYLLNHGPSPAQSLVLCGASLESDITVNAPSDYEISLSPDEGYQATIILEKMLNNRVDPTTIYIRLKSGKSIGTYNQNLSIYTKNASPETKLISLTGKVYDTPVITASTSAINDDYCDDSTIELFSSGDNIDSQYWEGPNKFFSTHKNVNIPNASSTMSGTYSVTGSIVIGGNLIFNGDFEFGNMGFSSAYQYKAPAGNETLMSEGTYSVYPSPKDLHGDFSDCGDNTTGTGNQMIINGAENPGTIIWEQSVTVTPGANYEFTYFVQSVHSLNPTKIQLFIDGVSLGPVSQASSTTCLYQKFGYIAHIPNDINIINLQLINHNTGLMGNDFALDDIEFRQVLVATDSVNINVHPYLPVDLMVTASEENISKGTPVTFTAHPTNPGDNPTYQWFVNGVPVFTSSENGSTDTYTSSNLNDGDQVSCKLISNYPCTDNNEVTSNVIIMDVLHPTNYWVGTNSTVWNLVSNWSENIVPSAGENINFDPNAVNDLYLDTDRTVGSINNPSDKTLVITVNNSLIVNGNIDTNNKNRILIKAAPDAFNGTLIFPNVTNPVYATIEMWSKAFINKDAPNDNEKYNWQFFGPPTHSYILDPRSDFYMSTVRMYVEGLETDKVGKQWMQLHNYDVIKNFLGYEITQDQPKKITFKGQLVKDNLATGELPVTSGSFYKGWHLLSNPYTAAINVKDIVFGPGMDEVIYIYNTGSFSDWQLSSEEEAVWNDSDNLAPGQYLAIPKNLVGFSTNTGVIPSMQAFLVGVSNRNTSPPSAGKTISYNYANLVKNTQLQRVREEKPKFVYSMVTITGKETYDKIWLFTDEACSPEYDNGWDGKKININENAVQLIATQGDREMYQIHATDDINNTYLLVYPDVDNASYTLHFKHENMRDVYNQIQLYDNLTKKLVDISADGSKYTFTANKNDNPTRFKIITETIEYQTRNTFIYPMYVDNQRIIIDNITNDAGIVRLFNVSGQLIGTKNFEAATTTEFITNHNGVYIVQVETNKRLAAQKVIVN